MHLKGDIFRMDPFYVILFLEFGIIFGVAGTLIVYAARYLPVDQRVAGRAACAGGMKERESSRQALDFEGMHSKRLK